MEVQGERDGSVGLRQKCVVLTLEPVGAVSERKIARYLPEQGTFGVLALVPVLVVAGDRLSDGDAVGGDDGPSGLPVLGQYAAGVEPVAVERTGVEDLEVVELGEDDDDQGRRPGADHPDAEIDAPHRVTAWASATATCGRRAVDGAAGGAGSNVSSARACSMALSLEIRSKMASRM